MKQPTQAPVTLEHRAIAAKLMQAVMFDNGMVNIRQPEAYPLQHVEAIAKCVANALAANPNFEFDEEVIETMAAGEASEMQALIDDYDTFKALEEALGNFFEAPMETK